MVSVEVIPLTHGIAADELFDVAVIFSMEPGWHTYWRNPGEAGMPTRFEWSLPVNFTLVAQREPTPSRHLDDGITSFIHEREAIYLFSIQAPQELADSMLFTLDIQWLECKNLCQPGSSQHQFLLKKTITPSEPGQDWNSILTRAEKRFPQTKSGVEERIIVKRDHLELVKKRSNRDQKLLAVDFFPYDEMIYDPGEPILLKHGFCKDRIIIPLLEVASNHPQQLRGVLVQTHASPDGSVTTSSIINQLLP